jgi:DNA-directed RNA polymerase specialized sigma24 family protein
MDELVRYTRALVFLQLQQLTGSDTFGKPELLLARAGFPHKEIAELLGKSPAAVAKAISRGRAAARTNGNDAAEGAAGG